MKPFLYRIIDCLTSLFPVSLIFAGLIVGVSSGLPFPCVDNDIAMLAVATGFIIAVTKDSAESAFNSSGNVFFTSTAERYDTRTRG